MIFGFGKKQEEDDYEDEVELVMFQGTFSGVEVDLSEHARLAQVGLLRAKEIVTDALERRAERIRIEPKGERAVIQLFVDGIGFAGGRMSSKEGMAVTQCLKLVSGMDVKNRKEAQSGGIRAEFDDRKYLLMMNTKPLGGGAERLTVDLIDVKNAKYSPMELGYSQSIIDKIRDLTNEKGIVLAAGPPDSEVTSLAFTIMRGIDAYVRTTFALINVGHRDLGSVSQFERRETDDLETALQRLIRMEGDVAYIEPFDNETTIKQAFEKCDEITLISEIAARDASSAIPALYKVAGDPKIVAKSINGVFGQKLIRKLCDKCKQPYRPNPKLIKKVGLPEEVQTLFRPPQAEDGEDLRVCRKCGGSGYFGRTAMIELIEMTDGMKQVVAAGKDASAIKAQAREENMPNFKDEGLRLVAEGVTSLEELQRAFRA